MISEQWSVFAKFKVEGITLEIIVLWNVNVAMNNRLHSVNQHKKWAQWEHDSNPISCQTNIEDTISLKRGVWMPPSESGWFCTPSNSFLSQTLDILVNSCLENWLYFLSFNHLNYLLLLFIDCTIYWTNLLNALSYIVLETLTHFFI